MVIPVFGHHEMTHALLEDLSREAALIDVVVVDNRGDYPPARDERVVRPGDNLGWAAGSNFGVRECATAHHAAFLWLNNDTRLATGFVAGLLQCWRETGAALVGPTYDCHWEHQRPRRPVPVERYRPRRVHLTVPFLDGTAMFVPASTTESIGLLDADTFSPVGWGAEIDYCLRARDAGLDVAITRLSYLHHEKSVTAQSVFDGVTAYAQQGYPIAIAGLERKWGPDWRRTAGIDRVTNQTLPPNRSARLGSRRLNRLFASRSPSSRSR